MAARLRNITRAAERLRVSQPNITVAIKKLEAELEYQQGFLKSVEKKLSNEKFVAHAPEAVVNNERKKQADALSKIKTLQESIDALKK